MAIIATTIRLNCRKVVLETLFCIGCKSAKMFVMGFLGEFWSWSTKLYYKKPYPLTLFFGEGIDNNSEFSTMSFLAMKQEVEGCYEWSGWCA